MMTKQSCEMDTVLLASLVVAETSVVPKLHEYIFIFFICMILKFQSYVLDVA